MFFKDSLNRLTVKVEKKDTITPLSSSCDENVLNIRRDFTDCFDLIVRETEYMGKKAAYILLDGMCNDLYVTEAIITLMSEKKPNPKVNVFNQAFYDTYKGTGCTEILTLEDSEYDIISGNVVMFIEGEAKALSFSAQGFVKKSIDMPQTEQQVNGSHQGFTDSFKDNVTLLRRRLKTPELKIRKLTIGTTSSTAVCICYLESRVSSELLEAVEGRLAAVELDIVHGAGAIQPFLNEKSRSVFSSTDTTERPDILAAKLGEGRIGILIDGSPYAIVIPYLMIDHFHTLDDYLGQPFYATFVRILKLVSFISAVFLPGFFVAVCEFHPELLPADVMFDISFSESNTPFPLVMEAFVTHLIYEIVREAGLQMPKMVGHAVSIVGGLVIGEAAVTAGLIAAPMLIIVGLTALTSAVLSSLHEPIAVMRFLFIILGGLLGIYGIILFAGLLVINTCSLNSYGVPFITPFAPTVPAAQRDMFYRQDWKKLGKRQMTVKGMRY